MTPRAKKKGTGKNKHAADNKPSCRICLDACEEREELVAPCQCKGSLAFVHLQCLHRWQRQAISTQIRRKANCEICHSAYTTASPAENDLLVICVSFVLPVSGSAYLIDRVFPHIPKRVYDGIVCIMHVAQWILTAAACYILYQLKYMSELEKWSMRLEGLANTNETSFMYSHAYENLV
jgi:E3 ubiquitin-protein ligase DOA10